MSTFFFRCLPLDQRFGRIVGETNAHARDLINKREQEVVEVRMMDVLQQVQEPSTHGSLGKLCA